MKKKSNIKKHEKIPKKHKRKFSVTLLFIFFQKIAIDFADDLEKNTIDSASAN